MAYIQPASHCDIVWSLLDIGQFVFASPDPIALQAPLPNVNSLTATMSRDSDLAVSIRLDEVPEVVKTDLLRRLHDIVANQAAVQPGDRQDNVDARILGAQLGTLPYRWLLTDGERIDLGLTIAPPEGGVTLDFDLIPRAGSELATLFARIQSSRTRLSALHCPDALVNFSAAWPVIGTYRRLVDELMTGARKSLDDAFRYPNSFSKSESDSMVVRDMFLPLVNTVETAMSGENFECYSGVREHRSRFLTMNVAFDMSNARELEGWLRKNAANLRALGAFESVTLDLATEGRVNIHQVWPSYPADSGEDIDFFGSKKPPLAFGFSDDTFLVSIGQDCVEGVQTMARSLGSVGATSLSGKPLDFELCLGRFIEKLAPSVRRFGQSPTEALFARMLATDDRMSMEVRHLASGLRLRYALEEGYVRFLGAAVGEGLMKFVPTAGK